MHGSPYDSAIQNLLDCHVLSRELEFSIVGCRLALYLGRRSHKPDPTNPGTDCVQCHAQGKGRVTFQRVFVYVECTEGS